MSNLDVLLQNAFHDFADSAPHDPDLAHTVIRRSHYRRLIAIAPVAAAAVVIGVAATVFLVRPGTVNTASSPAGACPAVQTGVLPAWARSGFSDPEPEMPYVTSDHGSIIAIVFADPLVSPAVPARGNKILWVTPDASPGDILHISGKLEGGSATMEYVVEGAPGPSTIDVPVPGCWEFDLTWGTHHDTIDIPYVSSAAGPAGT